MTTTTMPLGDSDSLEREAAAHEEMARAMRLLWPHLADAHAAAARRLRHQAGQLRADEECRRAGRRFDALEGSMDCL